MDGKLTAGPIRALHYTDRAEMIRDARPGSFWITDDKGQGIVSFWFFCPCGCGNKGRIAVGVEHKPIISPSWAWNGSTSEPTLRPSVDQKACGWHGWLRNGYWECVA